MRERIELGGHRGFRYAPLGKQLTAELAGWLDAEDVPGAQVLKPGRVWRVGDVVLKLSYPRRAADAWLRQSAAVRAADMHARIAPIRSPEPVCALDKKRGGKLVASMLVAKFVDGERLPQLWNRDARGREAFPSFLAAMHRRGVFHGDLGMFNMLWNGRDWVLLDLDGVRGRLHALRRKQIVIGQWARVLASVEDEPGVRAAFDAYLAAAPPLGDAERVWRRAQKLGRKYAAYLAEKRKRLALP